MAQQKKCPAVYMNMDYIYNGVDQYILNYAKHFIKMYLKVG